MPRQSRRRNDLLMQLQQAADALEHHYAGESLVLGNRTWDAAELAAAFRAHVGALNDAERALAEWHGQVAANRARHAVDIGPALVALRAFINSQFGATNGMLSEFGFVARQRTTPSTETVRAAVEKRRATRKARNTMGKKQRLAITGVVAPAPSAAEHTAGADEPT